MSSLIFIWLSFPLNCLSIEDFDDYWSMKVIIIWLEQLLLSSTSKMMSCPIQNAWKLGGRIIFLMMWKWTPSLVLRQKVLWFHPTHQQKIVSLVNFQRRHLIDELAISSRFRLNISFNYIFFYDCCHKDF